MQQLLEGLLAAIQNFATTVGFGTLSTIGDVLIVLAYALAIALFLRFDYRDGRVVKARQVWSPKALALMALTAGLTAVSMTLGAAIVIVPGTLSLWILAPVSFFLTYALFGWPAFFGNIIGNFIGDLVSGTFNIASVAGYISIVSIGWVVWRTTGHSPRLDNVKSWLLFAFAYVYMGLYMMFFWPEVVYRTGIMPQEVAWTAYFGGGLLLMIASVPLVVVAYPLVYPLVKRWNFYWRDIPNYYVVLEE